MLRYRPSPAELFFPGEIHQFKCLSGFLLFGEPNVTCSSSGWPSKLPRCIPCSSVVNSVEKAKECFPGHEENLIGSGCLGPPMVPNAVAYLGEHNKGPVFMYNYESQLSFQPFDSVRFDCLPSFVISGTSLSICLPDGQWTTPPMCSYNVSNGYCTKPTDVPNAVTYVDLGDDDRRVANPCNTIGGLFHVGDKVHYQCRTGYRLRGNTVSYCLQNNVWTTAPVCVPTIYAKAAAKCPMPPKPKFRNYPTLTRDELAIRITTDDCPIAYPSFEVNETISLDGGCLIRCEGDGSWTTVLPCNANVTAKSPTFPHCVEPPPVVVNARAFRIDEFNASVDLFGEDLAGSPIFEVFESVYYMCNPGWRIQGPLDINFSQCLRNGSWSNPPRCVLIPMAKSSQRSPTFCYEMDLPNVDKAIPVGMDGGELIPLKSDPDQGAGARFNIGSEVRYSCHCYFRGLGTPVTKCLQNGTWSQPTLK